MAQFSTHESVSLEKQVELNTVLVKTDSCDVDNKYEICKCAEWIKTNNFQNVCLQFPDHLLPDSSEIALRLQDLLKQTIYILADTAYGSCCIDYVAAAHINADAIIHFGPTCFSKSSGNIPFMNIYEKWSLDVNRLGHCVLEGGQISIENNKVVLVLDTQYVHLLGNIQQIFKKYQQIYVENIEHVEADVAHLTVIYIGNSKRKLTNIKFLFRVTNLYHYDTNQEEPSIAKFEENSKVLKKRYYLVEKIKDSKTLGIVIGTLAVENYLEVIQRIKNLISKHGKKYYLISVGKPTVAKLANFPEIDVYVMITCAMNEIFDSRDFYKPLVTPYDVEIALNPEAGNLQFSYDYNTVLRNATDLNKLEIKIEHDVSLLTGNIRSTFEEQLDEDVVTEEKQIALKSEGTVALNHSYGAGFLGQRSWKGLEQNLGQTEVKLVEEGRSGIAQSYKNENF